MFDTLTDKFEAVFKKLKGEATLSENNVKEVLREVKMALLEADVNFKVVRDFVDNVKEASLGKEVLKGVNPAQQFIHVVHEELVKLLSGGDGEVKPFVVQPGKNNIIMMLGLQGSGKTTFCGKIANKLQKERAKPLLVACDIYRPAAIEQLHTVGKSIGVPVFDMGTGTPVPTIVREAQKKAKELGRDTLIIDTAGRLHIDEVKMDELRAVRDEFHPDYTFLVCDAMTGQDAVNSAAAFDREVGIDGVCLTKMDSDARGGAALSIRSVTGKPVAFIGTGEKPDDLEGFHADRIAQRILGMGDVVSLVEKAQQSISDTDAQDMQQKLATGTFSFNDFLKQMRMIRRMGPLKSLLGMIPGVGRMLKDVDNDMLTDSLGKVEAIISSMTKAERENGDLLLKDGKRRARVAKGSGHTLQQVNDLVKQFDQMRQMMKQMAGGGGMMGMPGMPGMPGGGAMSGPGGLPPMDLMYNSGEMPDPNDPRMRKMLKQHKEMERQRKQAAAFMPKQKSRGKKKR